MIWQDAVYKCANGHEHRLTLPDPPGELWISHGSKPGKPPSGCHEKLVLVSKTPHLVTGETDPYTA